nr:hypothetical protein [Tanacetum cinerariifolium]
MKEMVLNQEFLKYLKINMRVRTNLGKIVKMMIAMIMTVMMSPMMMMMLTVMLMVTMKQMTVKGLIDEDENPNLNQNDDEEEEYEEEYINDDDMEEMDLKWRVAMISMRIKKFHKRIGRKLAKGNQDSRRRDVGYNGNKTRDNGRKHVYQDDIKALVTIDGKDIDWSGHVEKDAQNYDMMAYSSSNSGSDNEVKSYSKACEESYARLKKLYDDQRDKLGDASVEITAYTLALKKSVFMNKTSDLEDTPVNDIFADGMRVVPPSMTENYMPSGPDVEIDYSKFTYGPKQTLADESNSKPSQYKSLKPIIPLCRPFEVDTEKPSNCCFNKYFYIFFDSSLPPNLDLIASHISFALAISWNFAKWSSGKAIGKVVLAFLSLTLATTSSAVLGGICCVGGGAGGEVLEVSRWSPLLSSPAIENRKVKVYSKSILVLLIQSSLEALIPLDDPHKALKGKGIVNSVCFRHMTRNKAHLADYQEFKGGSVAFGGSNGRIT